MDYASPYMPVFSWTLDDDTAFTATVDGVATALTAPTSGRYGYSTLSGTLPDANAASDSFADAVGDALLTHANVASIDAVTYHWASATTGAGPVCRVDFTTTGAITTPPTIAATGNDAARLGLTSSPISATALAATPTTQWRFTFGPVAGFWWPAQLSAWDNIAKIRAVFTATAFANGQGEAVLWGERADMAIVLPTVRGAYVSTYRRTSAGYAGQAGISTLAPNNLLDQLLDAAAASKTIRIWYDVATYRTGKMTNQPAIADVRTMAESQASQDAIAQYVLAFSGVA